MLLYASTGLSEPTERTDIRLPRATAMSYLANYLLVISSGRKGSGDGGRHFLLRRRQSRWYSGGGGWNV